MHNVITSQVDKFSGKEVKMKNWMKAFPILALLSVCGLLYAQPTTDDVYYPIGMWGAMGISGSGTISTDKQAEVMRSLGFTVILHSESDGVTKQAMRECDHLWLATTSVHGPTTGVSGYTDHTSYEKGGFFAGSVDLCENYPATWDADSVDWWLSLAKQYKDTLTGYADELRIWGYQVSIQDFHSHWFRWRTYPGFDTLCGFLADKDSDKPTIAYADCWNQANKELTDWFGNVLEVGYIWDGRRNLFPECLDNKDGNGLDVVTQITIGAKGTILDPYRTWKFYDVCDKAREKYNAKHNWSYWPQIMLGLSSGDAENRMRFQTCCAYLSMCAGLKGLTFYRYPDLLDAYGKPYIWVPSGLHDTLDMIFGTSRRIQDSDISSSSSSSIRYYLDMWYFCDEMKKFGPILKNATWINGYENSGGFAGPLMSVSDGQSGKYQIGVFSNNSKDYFLITNRQLALSDTRTVTVKLKYFNNGDPILIKNIFSGSSQIIYHDSGDNDVYTYTVSIPPGRARLLEVQEASSKLFASGDYSIRGNNARKIVEDELTGKLYVCFKTEETGTQGSSELVVYASADNGKSWVHLWTPATINSSHPTHRIEGHAIALDALGNPYVVYVKTNDDGAPKRTMYVASSGETGIWLINHAESPSFVIDNNGYGHIACILNGRVTYLKIRLPENGKTEVLETRDIASVSTPPCITVTPEGQPVIFYEGKDRKVYGCTKIGSGWTTPLAISTDIVSTAGIAQPSADFGDGYIYLVYKINATNYRILWINPKALLNSGNVSTGFSSNIATPFMIQGRAVVWNQISGSYYDAFARFRTLSGWSSGINASNTALPSRDAQGAISFTRGKFYIMWLEDADYTEGNYATNEIKVKAYDFSDLGTQGLGNVVLQNPNGGNVTYNLKQDVPITYTVSGVISALLPTTALIYYNPEEDIHPTDWRVVGTQTITSNNTYSYNWKAGFYLPGKYSGGTHAKIKVALAIGYNDVSDNYFKVGNIGRATNGIDPKLSIPYIPPAETRDIPYEGISYTGWRDIGLQFSLDNGGNWGETMLFSMTQYPPEDSFLIDTIVMGQDTTDADTFYGWAYVGTVPWTAPTTSTSSGLIKLISYDTLGDTISDINDSAVVIPLPGGYENCTKGNQSIIGPAESGSGIGITYSGYHDASSSNKYVIYYTQTNDAYQLTSADTVDFGKHPSFAKGASTWLSENQQYVKYTYFSSGQPVTPTTTMLSPSMVGTTTFAPPSTASDADTAHIITLRRVFMQQPYNKTFYFVEHLKFRRTQPTIKVDDTIYSGTINNVLDSTPLYAPVIAAKGGKLHAAFNLLGNCYYFMGFPYSGNTLGTGIFPTVALTEGNVIYSYLSADSTKLIRAWRYMDSSPTSWIEIDTFNIGDTCNFMTSSSGLFYTLQARSSAIDTTDTTDTLSHQVALTRVYTFDPITQNIYQDDTTFTDGTYLHSYFNPASEFERVDVRTASRYGYYFVKTAKRTYEGMMPALYLESKPTASPYTQYRDRYVEYASCTIDYGADSLKYGFNRLESDKNYVLMLEFYYESDSTTTLEIKVGTNTDTIQIPAGAYSWYDLSLPSGSTSVSVRLKRISGEFVPLSRLIIRRSDNSGLFFSSVRESKPEKIAFCLFQPYPNPFADEATISYALPYETNVSLKVYDISGRLVNKLVSGKVPAGVHSVRWTGLDQVNRKCSAGVYFVRFEAGDYQASKKMVMIK